MIAIATGFATTTTTAMGTDTITTAIIMIATENH
jgi:hypothetical protein